MKKFILITSAFFCAVFYILSGGSEFEPASQANASAALVTEAVTEVALAPSVTPKAPVDVERAALVVDETVVKEPAKPETPVSVMLTSVPTTVRLVTEAAPTPVDELAKLGPEEVDQAVFETAVLPETPADIREVSGSRVNMRQGPGVHFSVVVTLSRGDEVEVLQEPGNGWVKLKVIEDGRIGWMSARLVTPSQF